MKRRGSTQWRILVEARWGAVLLRSGWWQPLAYSAVGASVLLTTAGWPEARLGLVANFLVIALIVSGQRFNWL